MNLSNPYTIIKILLVAIFALAVSPQLLAGETKSSSFGNVVLPNVVTPEDAQQCVEPADVMRRDHMKFLLQQRDETVLEGIRTKKYSFTGCINCHAQTPADGKIVRAENSAYFCTACHEYVSVKIDCFECHSDRPAATADRLSGNFNTQQLLAANESTRLDSPQRSRAPETLLLQVETRDD